MKMPRALIGSVIVCLIASLLVLAGCSNGSSQDSSQGDKPSQSSASSVAEEASDEVEQYIEVGGERFTTSEWDSLILANQLALDAHIGEEMTVVSEFQWVSSGNSFYYDSYDASISGDSPIKFDAPNGVMVLKGSVYVDIPDADRSIVASLKQGDMVEVHGVLSGIFPGGTIMLAPSSGAANAGEITIEKL